MLDSFGNFPEGTLERSTAPLSTGLDEGRLDSGSSGRAAVSTNKTRQAALNTMGMRCQLPLPFCANSASLDVIE